MPSLPGNFRYALRQFRLSPVFTAAAVWVSHTATSVVKPFGTLEGWNMSKAWVGVLLMSAALAAPTRVPARAETPQTPTIAEKTAGAQKLPGYFNLYWDAKQGKLWLEIDKWSSEFLYPSGLPAGIGSNDIGLDRGQLGATRIVRFERSGPKVLLIQENLEYRAVSNDPDERRAVHDSFAESALW